MGLNLHPFVSQELRRLGFYARDLILIQLLTLVHIGIFSFLLSDVLILQFKIGSCFFWLIQTFAIFFLSDRLFDKDLAQGFFVNVLNSTCSLPLFIGVRWLLSTMAFAGSTMIMLPIFLMLLGLPFDFWKYFLCLTFPYVALTTGYSSLLSLLTHGMRSYLMPILLFPLTIPILLLVISGSLGRETHLCFIALMAILLCIAPLIVFLIQLILGILTDN